MSSDCCGPPSTGEASVAVGQEDLSASWRDRSLALPALSGVLLAVGYMSEWNGVENVALVLSSASLAAGAWTFVPGAIKNLARGFPGVGLLMIITAIGAVALGHVREAAALAFLFSIAEALEDRAMDRARHGLGALQGPDPHRRTTSQREFRLHLRRLSATGISLAWPQARPISVIAEPEGQQMRHATPRPHEARAFNALPKAALTVDECDSGVPA